MSQKCPLLPLSCGAPLPPTLWSLLPSPRPPGLWLFPGAPLTHLPCVSCPEMIYRHVAVIDGEMVHFEILDTAGQVSSAGRIPWWQSGLPGKAGPALPLAGPCCLESHGGCLREKGVLVNRCPASATAGLRVNIPLFSCGAQLCSLRQRSILAAPGSTESPPIHARAGLTAVPTCHTA